MARPSKFDKVDQAQLEKLARAGWTDAQMADFFEVTEQTFNNWKKAHPAFFEALKDWKAEADHKVERALYERAIGYTLTEERIVGTGENAQVLSATKELPPDPTSMIFWLKNRQAHQWRDKRDHSFTAEDDAQPLKITFVDPE